MVTVIGADLTVIGPGFKGCAGMVDSIVSHGDNRCFAGSTPAVPGPFDPA